MFLALMANFAIAQVTVTFNVDMSTYTETTTFDVYIAGSIFGDGGWTEPGSDDAFKLTDDNEDGIYTYIANDVAEGEVQYKFFAGEAGTITWNSGEWTGDPNRTVTVGTTNMAVTNIWGDVDAIVLGINELSSNVRVYPNPSANGIFTLNSSEKGQVQVVNIIGSVVLSQDLTSSQNTIDLSNQASGIYFLNVTTKNKTTVIKAIVK